VLAPGASTKKAAAAAAKALGHGALRASGWAWPDAAAYEAEVALQQRFLVDTGLSSGARVSIALRARGRAQPSATSPHMHGKAGRGVQPHTGL